MNAYEAKNMMYYINENEDKLVIGDKRSREFNVSMDNIVDSLTNPIEEMYHWCKNEIYELASLQTALTQRDNINKSEVKKAKNEQSNKNDLENVKLGKKTITTLFKN
jgi:hypothetical protein